MTFVEMQEEVARRLEDEDFDNFTKPEIKRGLNFGVQDVAVKTNCLVGSDTASVTSGQREYDRPDNCLRITRVTYNSDRLGATTFDELDEDNKDWMDKTGTPTNYLIVGDELWLYPKPIADLTDGLEIFSIKMPDKMEADTDVAFNNKKSLYPYHELPILFALHRAYQKDEKFAPNAAMTMSEYVARLRLMRGEIIDPDVSLRMRGGRNY